MSDNPMTQSLETDINAWVETEIKSGTPVPDFWDDLSTTERLAAWLAEHGWRKGPDTHAAALQRVLETLLVDGTFNHRPMTRMAVQDALRGLEG